MAGKLTEPTWLPLPDCEDAVADRLIDGSAADRVRQALTGYDAVVLGCGLGNRPSTRTFVEGVLAGELPPAVIDADGINCLASLATGSSACQMTCVLTPHPAEMGRLCGLTTAEVMEQRWSLACEKAAEWGCHVLVKGPYTVVADPNGALAVLPIATPALATAGTGDVLAGMIGGLLAQGLDPLRAACVGAWLHGAAGLRCEHEIGAAGVLASDLLPRLPVVMATVRSRG